MSAKKKTVYPGLIESLLFEENPKVPVTILPEPLPSQEGEYALKPQLVEIPLDELKKKKKLFKAPDKKIEKLTRFIQFTPNLVSERLSQVMSMGKPIDKAPVKDIVDAYEAALVQIADNLVGAKEIA